MRTTVTAYPLEAAERLRVKGEEEPKDYVARRRREADRVVRAARREHEAPP